MLINSFENPPAENRPRPFWFFNGDMNRDEVRHQILEMKNKGLGGFYICARQGLRIPYLSDEWFDLCKYCTDLARENGLEVWLYDEYPYPSGMSGGEVTIQHPQAKQKILDLRLIDLPEGSVLSESLGEGILVSALAFPVNGKTVCWDKPLDIRARSGLLQNREIYQKTEGGASYRHNLKRYFTYGPSRELSISMEGNWKVLVAFAREIDDFKYYGTFMDPADPQAVQCFLETTHKMYRTKLGSQFGKTIKGMFGDETSFLGRWPWSPLLPKYFLEKYNYPLTDHLAALTDVSYPNAKRIRYNYFQCLHELLRDNYHKPISRWCEKNGIRYVTEIPSVRMSNQMYSHVPGGDPCHDKLGYPFYSVIDRDFHFLRQNPKAISAMARQFNRRDSLVEAFHSMGWTATLQDMKWQIDRLTLTGISLHNFHAFYYTVNGITKHDAPPSQFIQNPYWEYYRYFADYCARSSRFITETEASISVAILHPAISWCTQLRHPFHRSGYIGNDISEEKQGRQLIDDYKYICKTFFRFHIEYDDLDPEVMASGRIEKGVIIAGRAKYNVLVVPPLTCIEKYCFQLLQKFIESGGKVIFTGLTPSDCIEDSFDPVQVFKAAGFPVLEKNEYYGSAGKSKVNRINDSIMYISAPGGLAASSAGDRLADLVKTLVPGNIEVTVSASADSGIVIPAGQNDDAIITHCRENRNARFIMLASQNGKNADVKLLFKDCPDNAEFYELDLETGGINSIDAKKTNRGFLIDAPLSPWSARIFAMGKSGEKISPVLNSVRILTRPPEKTLVFKLDLDKKMPVSIAGNNVYRLEEMMVNISDKVYFRSKPNTFVEHLKESGLLHRDMIKFGDGFGTPQSLSVNYPIQISYRFEFTIEKELFPSDGQQVQISLLRDRMGIMGKHSIKINDRLLKDEKWKPLRIYDQNNMLLDITTFLKTGLNYIDTFVTAAEDWHGLSDPMYLLGNFGVLKKKGKFVLGKAAGRAIPCAKAVEAYPFYSGKFFFDTSILADTGTAGDSPDNYDFFTVELPEKYRIYECTELTVNGRELGARCFSPYIWQGPASLLKKGKNPVRLTIINTLGNMLEASYYDYAEQKTVII